MGIVSFKLRIQLQIIALFFPKFFKLHLESQLIAFVFSHFDLQVIFSVFCILLAMLNKNLPGYLVCLIFIILALYFIFQILFPFFNLQLSDTAIFLK